MKDDIHYRSNMSCTKCHRVENHRFPGFGPTITPEVSKQVQCTDCHAQAPHGNEVLSSIYGPTAEHATLLAQEEFSIKTQQKTVNV